MDRINPARNTSWVWWIITAVFFVLMFFPFLVDGAVYSVIISIFSLILFITGMITALIYGSRAAKINRFLRGEGILAHWKYSLEEWMQYTEKEASRDKRSKRTMFFVIAGMALVIGIIYSAVNPKSGVWVLVAMIGLIVILGFAAWVTVRYNQRQNKKYQGEAYIARDGVFLNRQLHLWKQLGAYLNSVEYVDDNPPLLTFTYFALTGTVTQEYHANVPVPKGQEAKARELLEELRKEVTIKS
jgi:hypothetical protein